MGFSFFMLLLGAGFLATGASSESSSSESPPNKAAFLGSGLGCCLTATTGLGFVIKTAGLSSSESSSSEPNIVFLGLTGVESFLGGAAFFLGTKASSESEFSLSSNYGFYLAATGALGLALGTNASPSSESLSSKKAVIYFFAAPWYPVLAPTPA